ncbi:NfeD family protein [Nitrincola tapanii]|uniref:NfeD family protein n=1 Tax=Nitrincola tapanii TaxID=1708751 RepID=A0A5A9W090_9GAMM|nr:NfeD family protein [Nitrincola tapanii]KAA0874170.1 NfeD family protein [Nitrincola tapanii]
MEAWHVWLIAAVILMIMELLSLGFVAFALGLAALLTAAASFWGLADSAQWSVFALSAVILAPLLKYLFSRYAPSQRRSALAGEPHSLEGVIIEQTPGKLRIQIEGDLYPFRSLSEQTLAVGTRVKVREFDGITAILD